MQKNITQLHNVNPEDFKKEILAGVQELITEHFKKAKSPDKLLTRREVAEMLSISLPTLGNYVKRGIIIEQKIGVRVLYKYSDIMGLFNNSEK